MLRQRFARGFVTALDSVAGKTRFLLRMRHARSFHRVTKAGVSRCLNTIRLTPDDRANPRVPKVQQMLRGERAGSEKIDGDARQSWRYLRAFPHAQHDRRTACARGVKIVERDSGVHYEHAFGQGPRDLVQVRAADHWVFVRITYDQKTSVLARSAFCRQGELRIKRI